MRYTFYQVSKYLALAALCPVLVISGCGGQTGTNENSSTAQSSSSSSTSSAEALSNRFGITQLYPSAPTEIAWDSNHWNNNIVRTIESRDPLDPTGWSQMRGSGTPRLDVLGDGRLHMSGGQPRLYINPYPDNSDSKAAADHLFTNVEFTGYFRRLDTSGAAYGGFTVGLRTGPMGHGTPGGDDCDGTTYYSRLRNDGQWQFQKELKHSASSVVLSQDLWSGAPLPVNQWIGIKYVVQTLANQNVKLEAWIDFSEGQDGGDWQLLGEYVDSGSWNRDTNYGQVDASGCPYDENYVISPGNGVAFIRNTEGNGEYKWVSFREIETAE